MRDVLNEHVHEVLPPQLAVPHILSLAVLCECTDLPQLCCSLQHVYLSYVVPDLHLDELPIPQQYVSQHMSLILLPQRRIVPGLCVSMQPMYIAGQLHILCSIILFAQLAVSKHLSKWIL